MARSIQHLVIVLLSLPAGALKHGMVGSYNESWPKPGPGVCNQATLVAKAFSCFKADNIPLFARHGLLLGTVREKTLIHFPSGIDNDFDVGYLPDGATSVFNYLKAGSASACFAQHGIRVDSNNPSPDWLQTCKAPPIDVQKRMMAGEPLTPQLKMQLESLCTIPSAIPGFNGRLSGTVNGQHVTVTLVASEFQRDGNDYFYDFCCATHYNCGKEVHHWFAKYGSPVLTPGEKMVQAKLPSAAFEPLKAVPFVLSRSETSEMLVPKNPEAVVAGLYGPNWQQPYNKYAGHEQIQRNRPQEYLC